MRQHRGSMKCALPVGEVGRGPRRGLGLMVRLTKVLNLGAMLGESDVVSDS
jgi:hypothetical protein